MGYFSDCKVILSWAVVNSEWWNTEPAKKFPFIVNKSRVKYAVIYTSITNQSFFIYLDKVGNVLAKK